MKRIWAPWRIQYILDKKPTGCIFCQKVKKGEEKENLLLYKNRFSLVMMNKFPYTCGHLLVAPNRHTADLDYLTKDEILDLFITLRRSIKLLDKIMKPHGFNVGMNLGRIAGAGIEQHLHLHIVPRWRGDTNFMPIVTDSMVVSESLYGTYDRLYPTFKHLRRYKY
jgi:ATP adenylyltransferase